MGLDMYLTAERYISQYDPKEAEMSKAISEIVGSGEFMTNTVSVEVMYWRKANAIHNWFVKNVQNGVDDCKTYYVSREKLNELYELCQEVLYYPEQAHELLPTASGFFFGSTDYGEWYLSDIKDTSERLFKILNGPLKDDFSWAFNYHSSW